MRRFFILVLVVPILACEGLDHFLDAEPEPRRPAITICRAYPDSTACDSCAVKAP